MHRACSTHMGDKKYVKNFVGNPEAKRSGGGRGIQT